MMESGSGCCPRCLAEGLLAKGILGLHTLKSFQQTGKPALGKKALKQAAMNDPISKPYKMPRDR
jgi:hypothetical protein